MAELMIVGYLVAILVLLIAGACNMVQAHEALEAPETGGAEDEESQQPKVQGAPH